MAGIDQMRVWRPALRSLYFVAGGAGYGALEILWRGETHISMILAGGVCLLILMRIAASNRRLPLLCATGSLSITGVELAFGCVVNLWLDLGVWDYSLHRLHLWGQICPAYTLLWYLLCLPVLPLCRKELWLERRIGEFCNARAERSIQDSVPLPPSAALLYRSPQMKKQ